MIRIVAALVAVFLCPLALADSVGVNNTWTDLTPEYTDTAELEISINGAVTQTITGIPGTTHSVTVELAAGDQICTRVRHINAQQAGDWDAPICDVIQGKPSTPTNRIMTLQFSM